MDEKKRNEWPTIGEIADLMAPCDYLLVLNADGEELYYGYACDLGSHWRGYSVGKIGPYFKEATRREPERKGITIWS